MSNNPYNVQALSSLSEMKSISYTVGTQIGKLIVTDPLVGGAFFFLSGNQSSLVSSDPSQGLYIPPNDDTTGAHGVWSRLWEGGLFYVTWCGADPTGSVDSRGAINAAFALVPDGTTIYFPANPSGATLYKISQYVNLLRSNVSLDGSPGTVIQNTFGSPGYQLDGLRIGNAGSGDGGTNPGTSYVSNISVSNLTFTGVRIGIWVVYAKNVTLSNIRGDGYAVVAAGNDGGGVNNDPCYDISLHDIFRTAANTADWYTVGVFNVTGFEINNVFSPFEIRGQAINVTSSTRGSVTNSTINQVNSAYDGILLSDAEYVTVSNNTITACRYGINTFYSASPYGRNVISNNVIDSSSVGIYSAQKVNTFVGNNTQNNTTSLTLTVDSTNEIFTSNHFEEGVLVDAGAVAKYSFWSGNWGINAGLFSYAGISTGIGTLDGTAVVTVKDVFVGHGTNTNDSASSGYIGELISSTITQGSAFSLTSGDVLNITNITLSAGNWEITGTGWFLPASSTNTLSNTVGITTSTGSMPSYTLGDMSRADVVVNSVSGNILSIARVGPFNVKLAGSTTYYLTALSFFTASTQTVYGTIQARRVR